MVNGKFKEVAKGVAYAAVGGAVFGFGLQYIFTATSTQPAWLPGTMTNQVILALLIGTAGLALVAYKPHVLKEYTPILTYGSVAAIGIGLWHQFFGAGAPTAPFRAPQTFAMPRTIMTAPMVAPSNGMVGPKII